MHHIQKSSNKSLIRITNNKYHLHPHKHTNFLLQRNELRRVSSTDTRAVMLHRTVGEREFTQIVTNHLSLDFNIVEITTIVNTNNTSNHFRNNDHVTKMSLHSFRTLILRSSSLLFINSYSSIHTDFWRRFKRAIGFLFKPRRKRRRAPAFIINYQTIYSTPTNSIRSLGDKSSNLSKSTPR